MSLWIFTIVVAALQIAVRLTGSRWPASLVVPVRVATRLMALAVVATCLFGISQVSPRLFMHTMVGDVLAKSEVASALATLNVENTAYAARIGVLLVAFMFDGPAAFSFSRSKRDRR